MLGFLVITGIIFVLVGLRALLKPVDAVATPFGLQVDGVDGLNHLRSSSGGVTIVAGLIAIGTLFSAALMLPALILLNVLLGGLFLGRLYSLIVDGKPGLFIWLSWGFEVFGLVQGLLWLWVYPHA